MEKVKIYILLQKNKGWFGRVYRFLTSGTYSHASISLSDSLDEFYSFRTKWGFCVEHPFKFDKEHKRNIACVIYEISVSQQQYETIQQEVAYFQQHRESYHYSYLSLFLGFMGIKHEFAKGFYCSRFVANLLHHSEAAQLHKHPSLYLPTDFFSDTAVPLFEGPAKEFSLSAA